MIKKLLYFILLFFLILSNQILSQNNLNLILEKNIDLVNKIDISDKKNKIYIGTPFNNSEFIIPPNADLLNNKIITQVDLVYTTYKLSEKFSQIDLNKKRLETLYSLYPNIFNLEFTNWNIIAQKGLDKAENGNEYFHGFIIHYRPEATKETMDSEIDSVFSFLGKIFPDDNIKPKTKEELAKGPSVLKKEITSKNDYLITKTLAKYPGGNFELNKFLNSNSKFPKDITNDGSFEAYSHIEFIITKTGEIKEPKIVKSLSKESDREVLKLIEKMPLWESASEFSNPVESIIHLPIKFSYLSENEYSITALYNNDRNVDSVKIEKPKTEKSKNPEVKILNNIIFPDSNILRTFEANQNWDNMLIICDLTGSMSKYTIQTLSWIRNQLILNKNKINGIVFFNDGDKKLDINKYIGSTGGIYAFKPTNFEQVVYMANLCMHNGGGGDTPENNMEAILKGTEYFPDYSEIIMIADNFATPRDLILSDSVKSKVRLILCGTEGGINTKYANFILNNGGSIHTHKSDIFDLNKFEENKRFLIDDKNYIITKGKISRLAKATEIK